MDEKNVKDIIDRKDAINKIENTTKLNINIPSNNKKTKKKNPLSFFVGISFVITLLVGIGYLCYNIFFTDNQTNQLFLILNSAHIVIISILFILTMLTDSIKNQKVMSIITSIFITLYITFNFLITTNNINLPTQALLEDFTNKNINEVMTWASANKIEIEQVYEYSDIIPEYHIISQSIVPNTLLKNVKKINLIVSSGPNYDKLVVIPNMIGWNIDDALKTINDNFLNNVNIQYVINEEIERDYIFDQSIKGQMRRNEPLTLKVSLGSKESLIPVNMIDLKNKKMFDATLWLKRNGIQYTLKYEFSDKVSRNYIIGQSILKDTTVDPTKDKVTLIVSKGKEIIVPDLTMMSIDDVTNWIIENNLKIKYEDRYDLNIPIGNIIETNYKEGDIIEEETTIYIVTSKGQLRMPKFSSLNEFRSWASKYDISIKEEYEFNENVKKGNIIKFSHEENGIIEPTDTIIVYISNGAPVTIPNFVGTSKGNIKTTCTKLDLICSFTYSGYSSTAKDVAVSQNKKAGSVVVSGTNVNINLSLGPAKTFTIQVSEAQLSIGSADGTIATLKSWFNKNYPGVTFNFVKKASNELPPGYIHENSPIKDNSKVTQGKTYYVWITN